MHQQLPEQLRLERPEGQNRRVRPAHGRPQQRVDAPCNTARGFAAAGWCDNGRRLGVQLCPARCDFHYNATVYD